MAEKKKPGLSGTGNSGVTKGRGINSATIEKSSGSEQSYAEPDGTQVTFEVTRGMANGKEFEEHTMTRSRIIVDESGSEEHRQINTVNSQGYMSEKFETIYRDAQGNVSTDSLTSQTNKAATSELRQKTKEMGEIQASVARDSVSTGGSAWGRSSGTVTSKGIAQTQGGHGIKEGGGCASPRF